MRTYGRIDVGATAYELASDTKIVARFVVSDVVHLSRVAAYLDGLGSGALGPQAVKAVIYDGTDALVAESAEVVIAPGQAPGWVDFEFDAAGDIAIPGVLQVGLHAGGAATHIARVYGSDPHGAGGKWNNDAYADGASNPFGAATALTSDLSIFALGFIPFASEVPVETDLYYSRLPWHEAQEVLARSGPIVGAAEAVAVGWHDTFLDPEMGANAVVRDTSPLVGLLGNRIKVTAQGVVAPRTVYAFVHNVAPADTPWDLSLTRHAFAQLGLLSSETIPAVVEVVR